MFNSSAIVRSVLEKLSLVIVLLLASVSAIHLQRALLQVDPAKLASHGGPHEALLPESAYLSNTAYTNVFFGFGLDLPIAVQGHLVRLPLMPERQHALLAIAYQDGDRSGSLTIDAIEPAEGLEGFSAKKQREQINAATPACYRPGHKTNPRSSSRSDQTGC